MAHNRRLGELHAGELGGGVHIGEQQDKGRARTHNDGVDKHAQHLNHALAHRMLHIGRGRRIRRRAHTGFIRKQAALDAQHHRLRHRRADKAAGRRLEIKCFIKNQRNHRGHRR